MTLATEVLSVNDPTKAVKLSISMPPSIVDALRTDAIRHRRELTEHIQRILTEYAIKKELLPKAEVDRIKLFWGLVERAVEAAKRICREGGFDSSITYKAVQACLQDQQWVADYRELVQDDIYKNGNPLKGPINREIGYRIRAGIDAKVLKNLDGKPAIAKVLGSIIQSYTPMESFNEEAVAV